MTYITPTEIKLLQKEKHVTITFTDGQQFVLPCEYLRVFSPSAEVRGHGAGPMTIVTGKENVNIIGIDPVGNYAVKFIFDDGHSSGIYSWETLYDLGKNYQKNWEYYILNLTHLTPS